MSSVEALTSIQEYVAANGDKMMLGQVLAGGGDQLAGIGYDKITDVVVEGLDARVFPSGVLSGKLSCRAVLLEPSVTDRFVGMPGVEGAQYLRTRLEYEEPQLSSIPNTNSALTVGGSVMHIAVLNMTPGDADLLDAYYARLAAFTASGSDNQQVENPNSSETPKMPRLHNHYDVDIPGVPNFKGTDASQRAQRRLELRRMGFFALQRDYPAARVLRVGSQGFVNQDELEDWAQAFVS